MKPTIKKVGVWWVVRILDAQMDFYLNRHVITWGIAVEQLGRLYAQGRVQRESA